MPNQAQPLSSRVSTAARTIPAQKKASGVARSSSPFGYYYDLSILPVDQFEPVHAFVRAVFDQGRQRFKMDLATVTSSVAQSPQAFWDYLNKTDSLGVSMKAEGETEKFHIWITPSYKQPLFKFYMTLVHELVHGYAGMQYGHNAHWRRWFYRTLWHLVEAGMMPAPEDELKYVCTTVEHAYNYTPKLDPMLTILEAFHKAESEHDQVMKNYFIRLGLNA